MDADHRLNKFSADISGIIKRRYTKSFHIYCKYKYYTWQGYTTRKPCSSRTFNGTNNFPLKSLQSLTGMCSLMYFLRSPLKVSLEFVCLISKGRQFQSLIALGIKLFLAVLVFKYLLSTSIKLSAVLVSFATHFSFS